MKRFEKRKPPPTPKTRRNDVGVHGPAVIRDPNPMGPKSERDLLINSAHLVFDRLWSYHRGGGGPRARREDCYAWLAEKLGIDPEQAHFSTMSKEQMEQAIRLSRKATAKEVIGWARRRKTHGLLQTNERPNT